MIILFKGEDARIAASIALNHRLFVSGWSLSGDLRQIKNGNSHVGARVAIYYKDSTPVGVCLQKQYGFIEVFVRKSERCNGIGRQLVQQFKSKKSYAMCGVDGSEVFWNKVGVKCG